MSAPTTASSSPARRAQLNRRSLHLAYATTGYNLLEGVVAVTAGVEAWRGEPCDDCALPAAAGRDPGGCGCGPNCADNRRAGR